MAHVRCVASRVRSLRSPWEPGLGALAPPSGAGPGPSALRSKGPVNKPGGRQKRIGVPSSSGTRGSSARFLGSEEDATIYMSLVVRAPTSLCDLVEESGPAKEQDPSPSGSRSSQPHLLGLRLGREQKGPRPEPGDDLRGGLRLLLNHLEVLETV